MSKASKISAVFDAAAAVTLRAVTDGAETATATETAISLNELDGAYWHNGEIPNGAFEVWLNVTALNLSTNTYVFSLLADDVSTVNDTPTTVISQAITAVGVYKFLVDSKTLAALDTESSGTDKWLAAKMTIAGTPDSPSITYGAWLGKVVSA